MPSIILHLFSIFLALLVRWPFIYQPNKHSQLVSSFSIDHTAAAAAQAEICNPAHIHRLMIKERLNLVMASTKTLYCGEAEKINVRLRFLPQAKLSYSFNQIVSPMSV